MTSLNTEPSFILLGHRGIRGHLENTIPAFKKALQYADGIEFDVMCTRDKKLVILHDEEFKSGNRIYKVKDLTYKELLRIHPKKKLVPTLNQVLRLPSRVFNIDIKDPSTITAIVEIIREKGIIDNTVISLDSTELLNDVLNECSECKVGFSIVNASNLKKSLNLPRRVYSIHVPLDLIKYVGKEGLQALIRFYNKKGLKVWIWNYKMDETRLLSSLNLKVDAIISDNPLRLKKFISTKAIDSEAIQDVGSKKGHSTGP